MQPSPSNISQRIYPVDIYEHSSRTTGNPNKETPPPEFNREQRPREQFLSEIRSIKKELDNFRKGKEQDAISVGIGKWVNAFERHMKSENYHPRDVLNEHINYLKEILKDPINDRLLLDDQAFLGSDGVTYGSKTLKKFKHEAPEDLQKAVPYNPQTIESHLPVRHLIRWLIKHNAFPDLNESQEFPAPKKQKNRSRGTLEERMNRILGTHKEECKRQEEQKGQIDSNLQEMLRDISIGVAKGSQLVQESYRNQMQEARVEISGDIARVKGEFENQLQEVRRGITLLENELVILLKENQDFRNQIDELGTNVSAAIREEVLLKLALNETKQSIKDLDKARKKQRIETFMIILTSFTATCALGGVLAAMGSSLKGVVLFQPKGAILKLALPI